MLPLHGKFDLRMKQYVSPKRQRESVTLLFISPLCKILLENLKQWKRYLV
jgi:hypothetical protein